MEMELPKCCACGFALKYPVCLSCGCTYCKQCIDFIRSQTRRCLKDDTLIPDNYSVSIAFQNVIQILSTSNPLHTNHQTQINRSPPRPSLWKSGIKRDSWCDPSNPCSTCSKYVHSQKDGSVKDPKKPCEMRDVPQMCAPKSSISNNWIVVSPR